MSELDWTEPPAAGEPDDLWVALHDGSVLSLVSDRLSRELSLAVELGFPAPAEPCPKVVELRFRGVTHALLFTYWNWPGPYPRISGPPTPEAQATLEEFFRKSRTETSDLTLINQWSEDEVQVEIMQAERYRSSDRVTAILDGTTNVVDSASAWRLRIASEALDVVLTDGSPLGMDELLRLGKTGWDEWSAAAKARRSATAIPFPGDGD